MTRLATAFEPSSAAAASEGPKQRTPSARSASARPATRGASGPTMTRSASRATAAPTSAPRSAGSACSSSASAPMPGLPGAHSTSGAWGERRSARTMACSRPPEPPTRTRTPVLQRRDEVVDGDRRQRLEAPRATGPELERDPRDGLLVRRLDDGDEVELPERGPLGPHAGPELLDLRVDLLDALRVVL